MQSTESPPTRSRVSEAVDWTKGLWDDHPKKSLETFGRQITMGIEAITELF
ncbi:ABC transporter permease, partial [Nocardia salmonicida]